MVYLNRHVAVQIYQIGSNYRIKPEHGQLACLSVVVVVVFLFFFCLFFFFFWGGGGVRVGHVRSRRSLEHEFKRLV